jgi:hypothetical protein
MVRRIGGAGGGSDKGVGAAPVAVVAVAGLAMAGLGGAGAVGAVGAGSGAAGAAGVSGTSGVSVSVRLSKPGRQQSRTAQRRLSARGLRVRVQAQDSGSDCAARAYGQVVEFFRGTPCVGVYRALFEVRGSGGVVVLVAASWVHMPSEAGASAYRELVDTHGTGNITELSRERGRHRDARFTGHVYASRRDGTVVANAQAQPVGRGAAGLALTEIVNDVLAGDEG